VPPGQPPEVDESATDEAAMPLEAKYRSVGGMSCNVWRIILFTTLMNLSSAIWQVSVWSPFLKHIFHDNISLGCIAAAGSCGELVAAVLSGFGADRFGKEGSSGAPQSCQSSPSALSLSASSTNTSTR
jgi:hypothetical protein